jgi:PAS domain S-box-containing protein
VAVPADRPWNPDTLFRAVAAVADALYVVNAEGRIAFLNPAALKILGYTDERELIGRVSHDTVHYLRLDGSPFPAAECPLLRPRVTGKTVHIEHDAFVRKDGTQVPVSYSSSPVDLTDGRGTVVAFRDISERLRLSGVEASRARITQAADDARRKIERDLHDGVQQHLVALALRVRTVRAATPREAPELQGQLDSLAAELDAVLDELREVSRGIHPAALVTGGLGPALNALARRAAVPVRLNVLVQERLPEPIEIAAYYVVAEALTNAVKHAHASTIDVRVDTAVAGDGADELRVCVRDDGRGGADLSGGSGLVGLKDRVEALGGRLWVQSVPGAGTTVQAKLPLSPACGLSSDTPTQ